METSLHQQLKQHFAGPTAQTEVRLGSYRIDAVVDGRLVEVQHASLGAIRRKIRHLCETHRVLIVKPLVQRKYLIKLAGPDGPELQRRQSPKSETPLDLFDELVHFTEVFPHPRLEIQLVAVEVAEYRYPGHGRRRRWRKRDHVVLDQQLLTIGQTWRIKTTRDLIGLLPGTLPRQFHTGELAQQWAIPRFRTQRIAYCLREMQAIRPIGKQGNAILYRRQPLRKRRAA